MYSVWAQQARPAAEKVVAAVDRGEVVAVVAAPSTGKSTVLSLVAAQLSSDQVFRTGMPTFGDDAGPVALATLAAQLEPSVLEFVKDIDKPWRDKVGQVVQSLGQRDAVVLVDDLRRPASGHQPLVFDDQATDLIDGLFRERRIRLVTTSSHKPLHRASQIGLAPQLDASMVAMAVNDLASDADLAPGVSQMLAASAQFVRRSPVEVRLAVDLIARGMSLDAVAAMSGPRALARAFLTRLPVHERLALQRLAVMRLPCDQVTFDRIAAIGGPVASRRWKAVAAYQSVNGWVLPAMIVDELQALADEGRVPPDPGRVDEARRIAIEFHTHAFRAASEKGQVAEAVRHELEVVHHLTQARDAAALLDRSLWFVTQYDALGRVVGSAGAAIYRRRPIDALPRDAGPPPEAERLLRDALRAYERALAHDPCDAYALHYRAYNHDILADDAAAVESGYRAALAADPDQIWHHGRLITFLITRGRANDARAEWGEALRQLDGLRGQSWLYTQLHRPVALLLLHRGNSEFAQDVLGDVPAQYAGAGWFPSLRRRLQVLKDQAEQRLVFPPSIVVADRWSRPRLVWNEAVVRWTPGWIELIDDEQIIVRYAERRDGNEVFGREKYTHAEFRERCAIAAPPAGTFVERLWLEGSSVEVIRCYPAEIEVESVLPGLPFPPPARYLNRRAADARK
ncbi:MAG: hypothetical protein R3B06_04560 [Kofleriaceae bacterium]